MIRSIEPSAKNGHGLRSAQAIAAFTTLIVATALLIGANQSSAAGRSAPAHVAGTLHGTANAHLHLVRAEGSELIEEGPVSGVLSGSASGEFHTGAIFTASFTIRTHDGTISGHGQATPHGTGRYQSFSGSFLATNGSGRYAHIRGRGGLYGVFDRRTDSVVIQTTGTLTY
jgi:hypothetical protein